MSTIFRAVMKAAPLLPSNIEHTDENILAAMQKLRYPVLATVKLDGIRAVRLSGTLLSCSLKQIPNKSICARGLRLPAGFDMELWHPNLTFNQIQSIIMSESHPDEHMIQFHLLDVVNNNPYKERCIDVHQQAYDLLWQESNTDVFFQYPARILDAASLLVLFKTEEAKEQEGICFRTPDSPYKQGRSTLLEQYLIKLCRWLRMEVRVTGFIEQVEVGKGEKPKNTLGSFKVIDKLGRQFDVGSGVGLTEALRQHIWDNKPDYLGKTFTIKYKPCGTKDNPRHPIFVGWREKGY